MNKIFLIFFLSFPLFLRSEENFTALSLQAEALWEAHDNAAASKIYENLFSRSLPDWQQARLFYNLGTIRLSQQQAIEALAFFQKINPTNLSLPHFGRNLLLNIGIAYLQYARTLAPSSSLDQQAIFIEQSLNAFDQARQLDCQVQKAEQWKEISFSCHPSFLLDQWMKSTRFQLNTINQQKRHNWIEQASMESLASFLYNNMQEWMDRLNAFQEQASSSIISYFQHQAESFTPIWNTLQQKKFSLNQKTAFEQSVSAYLSALQALNQHDLSSILKEWKQSIEFLTPLTFQDNKDVQQARLTYEILLLQEMPITSAIKRLLTQVDALKVAKEQSALLEQVKGNLKLSLEELQDNHSRQAHFFLIAGFSQFDSLFEKEKSTPAAILQQALDQANRTLLLSFISEAIPKDSSRRMQIRSILKNQQQNILIQAEPFIPSVLNEQDVRFHQAKDLASLCQQSPWDQVIPLYDRGYRASQSIGKQFNQAALDFQTIVANQEQTIKDWQQAIKLILHPPQQNTSVSTPQKWTETLSLIQEMYLQDQSQPEQKAKELHSW